MLKGVQQVFISIAYTRIAEVSTFIAVLCRARTGSLCWAGLNNHSGYTHRTKSIVTEIVVLYIPHNT